MSFPYPYLFAPLKNPRRNVERESFLRSHWRSCLSYLLDGYRSWRLPAGPGAQLSRRRPDRGANANERATRNTSFFAAGGPCAVTGVPASVVSLTDAVPCGLRAGLGDVLCRRRADRGANAMSAPTFPRSKIEGKAQANQGTAVSEVNKLSAPRPWNVGTLERGTRVQCLNSAMSSWRLALASPKSIRVLSLKKSGF